MILENVSYRLTKCHLVVSGRPKINSIALDPDPVLLCIDPRLVVAAAAAPKFHNTKHITKHQPRTTNYMYKYIQYSRTDKQEFGSPLTNQPTTTIHSRTATDCCCLFFTHTHNLLSLPIIPENIKGRTFSITNPCQLPSQYA